MGWFIVLAAAALAFFSRGTHIPILDDAVGWYAAEMSSGKSYTGSLITVAVVGYLVWSFWPGKSKGKG